MLISNCAPFLLFFASEAPDQAPRELTDGTDGRTDLKVSSFFLGAGIYEMSPIAGCIRARTHPAIATLKPLIIVGGSNKSRGVVLVVVLLVLGVVLVVIEVVASHYCC